MHKPYVRFLPIGVLLLLVVGGVLLTGTSGVLARSAHHHRKDTQQHKAQESSPSPVSSLGPGTGLQSPTGICSHPPDGPGIPPAPIGTISCSELGPQFTSITLVITVTHACSALVLQDMSGNVIPRTQTGTWEITTDSTGAFSFHMDGSECPTGTYGFAFTPVGGGPTITTYTTI